MLHWAVVFLVVAIIAAVFGFGGIAGPAVAHRQGPVLPLPGIVRGLAAAGPHANACCLSRSGFSLT